MAIPAAIWGAGKLIGHFTGKGAKKGATALSPEEQQYRSAQTGLATTLQGQGGQLFSQGQDQYQTGQGGVRQSMGYYSSLLGGNRAQMMQAVAPEAEQIADVYRGADAGITHSNARGAVRDQQRGELQREKAGRIAGLIGGVRGSAADRLAGTGLAEVSGANAAQGNAINAYGNAGSIYGTLTGAETARRQQGNDASDAEQRSMGGLTADILKIYGNKQAKKA